MGSLGQFGETRDGLVDTFGYFGHEVRVNPDLSELDIIDFMETALSVDNQDPKAILILKKFLRELIHPDDFDVFWDAARANRQRVEDVQAVTKAIIEAVTGRPTGQPSDSSRGPSNMLTTSKGTSSDRVLTRLDGRPDLQLALVKARQARRAG